VRTLFYRPGRGWSGDSVTFIPGSKPVDLGTITLQAASIGAANKRLKADGARRLRNESFFSAPQLKLDPLAAPDFPALLFYVFYCRGAVRQRKAVAVGSSPTKFTGAGASAGFDSRTAFKTRMPDRIMTISGSNQRYLTNVAADGRDQVVGLCIV